LSQSADLEAEELTALKEQTINFSKFVVSEYVLGLLDELVDLICILSERSWYCDQSRLMGGISRAGFLKFVKELVRVGGRGRDLDFSFSIK
jgi:hypothetical protein